MGTWEIICSVISSGVLQWTLVSYPFHLLKEGEGLYFVVHITIALVWIQPILLKELAVGQLNQQDIVNVWGSMVPILKGKIKDWLIHIHIVELKNVFTKSGNKM